MRSIHGLYRPTEVHVYRPWTTSSVDITRYRPHAKAIIVILYNNSYPNTCIISLLYINIGNLVIHVIKLLSFEGQYGLE